MMLLSTILIAALAAPALAAAPEPDLGYRDALIERAHQLLGENRYRLVFELGLNHILDDIRDDLNRGLEKAKR